MLKNMNLKKPLHRLLPWRHMDAFDNLEFRNLTHFTNVISGLTQKQDDKCGVTYAQALKDFKNKKSRITPKKEESIRNLVRSNLFKRGLITEEVYENFRYSYDGTQIGVDVGKYAAGEPDCVITPSVRYVDFFYELFISISYPCYVKDKTVQANVAKLLATVEELERQHIFIKITLVFPCLNPAPKKNLFMSIPLFSHKDTKSVATMSAVLNDHLLRKFSFAILEEVYKEKLYGSYGQASSLTGAMCIGDTFNEVEFFTDIRNKVDYK